MAISFLTLTKNNKPNFNFLSLPNYVTGFLVSDDHSTDGTVEMVKKAGGVVYPNTGMNLGARKQFLVEKAKEEWILILDADESLSPELQKEIQDIVDNPKKYKDINGFRIPYQNHVFGKPVYFGGEKYSKVRLFRRGKGHVTTEPLHEEVEVKGTIVDLKGKILHHSYTSLGQLFGKFTRYAWTAAQQKNERHESLTFSKLFLYPAHMFWARFIKDRGYKDGLHGFVLAAAFEYMENMTYWFLAYQRYKKHLAVLFVLLTVHSLVLSQIKIIDWPEMLLYSWFSSSGLVLYKDFIIGYPPGSVLLLKPLYELFGYTLTVYRLQTILLFLSVDTLLFACAIRLYHRILIASAVVIFFAVWSVMFEGFGIWFELLQLPFYLLGFLALYNYSYHKRQSTLLFLSGLFAILFLIKQTALIPMALVCVGLVFIHRWNILRSARAVVMFLSLPILSVLLVSLYFYSHGILTDFLYWSYLLPLVYTRPDSRYAVPASISDLVLIAPVALIVISTFAMGFARVHRNATLLYIGLGAVVGLSLAAMPRWGMHRLIPALAAASLLFGYWLLLVREFVDKRNRLIVFMVVLAVVGGTGRSLYKFVTKRYPTLVSFYSDTKAGEVAAFLQKETGGAPLALFGDYDYMYYYQTRTLPIVHPWVQLYPVFAESPHVQDRIVLSLDQNKTEYVAYIPYHPDQKFFSGYEPTELLNYLESNYERQNELPYKGWLYKRKFYAPAP